MRHIEKYEVSKQGNWARKALELGALRSLRASGELPYGRGPMAGIMEDLASYASKLRGGGPSHSMAPLAQAGRTFDDDTQIKALREFLKQLQ